MRSSARINPPIHPQPADPRPDKGTQGQSSTPAGLVAVRRPWVWVVGKPRRLVDSGLDLPGPGSCARSTARMADCADTRLQNRETGRIGRHRLPNLCWTPSGHGFPLPWSVYVRRPAGPSMITVRPGRLRSESVDDFGGIGREGCTPSDPVSVGDE